MKPGEVTTASGALLKIARDEGWVVITGAQGRKARVVSTDLAASNGVIHVIDSVLLPA